MRKEGPREEVKVGRMRGFMGWILGGLCKSCYRRMREGERVVVESGIMRPGSGNMPA